MPELTFYWQFLTDGSKDSHIFGGIQPEVLGTIYLTLSAMLFSFLRGHCRYLSLRICQRGKIISLIRICISTLAGVPSLCLVYLDWLFY